MEVIRVTVLCLLLASPGVAFYQYLYPQLFGYPGPYGYGGFGQQFGGQAGAFSPWYQHPGLHGPSLFNAGLVGGFGLAAAIAQSPFNLRPGASPFHRDDNGWSGPRLPAQALNHNAGDDGKAGGDAQDQGKDDSPSGVRVNHIHIHK